MPKGLLKIENERKNRKQFRFLDSVTIDTLDTFITFQENILP